MNTKLDLEDFFITSVSGKIAPLVKKAFVSPLGLLVNLPGTWNGAGFNQIWRPFHGTQDHFLELNETSEKLQFVEIPGDIPNRGLLQSDITLNGITYLQKVSDVNVLTGGKPSGIHIEPGIWLNIPSTANPSDAATVARMANIPHGTSLVAQGSATTVTGPPTIPPVSITPFPIGSPGTTISFPESTLSNVSTFRTSSADIPNITQPMVDNPNVVLAAGLKGKTITTTTILQISTIDLNPPSSGGGTSNIAFLQGALGAPNAQSAQMDATFWIEEFTVGGKPKFQLQYSQRVLLNFNGISWPHVSVATLIKDP